MPSPTTASAPTPGPHKLFARPKSDKDATPIEISVTRAIGDEAAARKHIEATCPTLVLVEAPADAGKGPMNQAVGPDGKPLANDAGQAK